MALRVRWCWPGRREEAEHVPDDRNQDDHQPQCRARVVDDWERGGTIAA